MADNTPSLVTKVPGGDILEEKGVTHTEQAGLDKTLTARLRNPLEGLSRSELMHEVEQFASRRGLESHLDELKKGALVAQNPDAIDEIDLLSSEERQALHDERTHKWRMPMRLFFTIALCSIGAAVQGWDQTGSNGANIFFPPYYGIDPKGKLPNGGQEAPFDETEKVRRELIIGILNAAPYLGSA